MGTHPDSETATKTWSETMDSQSQMKRLPFRRPLSGVALAAAGVCLAASLSGCGHSGAESCSPVAKKVLAIVLDSKSSVDPAKWASAADDVAATGRDLDGGPADQIQRIVDGLRNASNAIAADKPNSAVPDKQIDTAALAVAENHLLWASVELIDMCP